MGEVSKLSENQVQLLEQAFRDFEINPGKVPTDQLGFMFDTLNIKQPTATVDELINEFDPFGEGEVDFEDFKTMAARFMSEEINPEQMQNELREAFRLYDREGNGYITTEVMREILAELDNKMSEEDLDAIIDEIDADGSGTVDFEEFMEVMTGGDD